MTALRLTHLTFIGANVERATVEFGPATTIIRGPSDTGKSFIVDAVDFMLGSRNLKDIPQRNGYSNVLLGLALPDGELVTLSRKVSGGRFSLYYSDLRDGPLPVADQMLADRHDANSTSNLSRFLLTQIKLDQRRIRKNRQGETDSLSFRDIAHLCIVDETQMQADTPPALRGNVISKTKEISTLRMLLENEDDSDLTASTSKADHTRLTSARADVIDRLIGELEEQIANAPDQIQLRDQRRRLDATIKEQTAAISELASRRSALTAQLAKLDRLVNATLNRADNLRTLSARFRLLLAQYNSDLARLDMIGEAGSLLNYFTPGVCVFCGAEPDHQHLNLDCPDDTTAFAESVAAETAKTTALRDDLTQTLTGLQDQLEELELRRREVAGQHGTVRTELARLDQTLQPHQGDLDQLINARTGIEKTHSAYEQIERLIALKAELAAEDKAETTVATADMSLSTLSAFSDQIRSRLQTWGVPDANHVRYDRAEQDLVAGDQLRSAHGKGVRAILHAAFTVGLAQYCFDREYPHPGFVILDSPLVTYRPPAEGELPDPDGQLDRSVAGNFYRDIQENFAGQVIIMENTDPPQPVAINTIDIAFTRNRDYGRFGFFPIAVNTTASLNDQA